MARIARSGWSAGTNSSVEIVVHIDVRYTSFDASAATSEKNRGDLPL